MDKNTPRKNITKAEYEALLKQYGTENYDERPDQTAEILAMTAEPEDKPVTPTASTVYVNGTKKAI